MMAMKLKRAVSVFIILIFFSYSISLVYAITGSIGNARMVLRVNTGDKIEKYVLVKNVNDVPVDIELIKSGDLADYIEIKDNNFTLAPGQDRKAYFTIDIIEPGTSESKINVKFSPKEVGNGVGLSSTIIVIAEGSKKSFFDFFTGNNEEENIDENQTVSFGLTKEKTEDSETQEAQEKTNFNILMVYSLITLVLFVVLLALLVYLKNKNRYKKGGVIKSKKSVQMR